MEEDIRIVLDNQTLVEELMDDLRLAFDSKRFAELTVYSIADASEQIIRSKELKFYENFLATHQEAYSIALEIRAAKEDLFRNYRESRVFLKSLMGEEELQQKLEQLLVDEEAIDRQRQQLISYKSAYFLSEQDIEMLIDEQLAVDASFFKTFERLIDNIRLRDKFLNKQALQKHAAPANSTSQDGDASPYLLAQKLGLRKLCLHVKENLGQLLGNYDTFWQCIDLMSNANEETLSDLNDTIVNALGQRLVFVLRSPKLYLKETTAQTFEQSALAFSYFTGFLVNYMQRLFAKYNNKDLYFQNNAEKLFSIFEPQAQHAVRYLAAKESLIVEEIKIIESLLAVYDLVRSCRPKGMTFFFEKSLKRLINDCKAAYKSQVKSFNDKLTSLKDFGKHKRLAKEHLVYFGQLLQFRFLNLYEDFVEITYGGLAQMIAEFSKLNFFKELQEECLAKWAAAAQERSKITICSKLAKELK